LLLNSCKRYTIDSRCPVILLGHFVSNAERVNDFETGVVRV